MPTPSLTRTVVPGTADLYVWGLLYDPNRMAGMQVILQGLLSGATVVAPSLHDPLSVRIAGLVAAGVNALSATPSLWRQILQLPVSHAWPLRQITLGGEIADQRVLDALAAAFPSARIVHVFASTETGAAFSVKDGREGFPVDYLTDPPRHIRLEIREGVLHVHSPDVSAAASDGFASTGDIVEIVDDRVLFRGRSSGVVNVGGSNVWPEEVETILRTHPDVAEAVVAAKPNPMTGNVLVARVALIESADPAGASKRLRSWVRERAPRTHVPASVEVVGKVDVSTTGKLQR
jgi:acyl-CoA synthetase (AMP-forming)/AMP-acid ligase II